MLTTNQKTEELLQRIPLQTDMLNTKHVNRVLNCLAHTIKRHVPGDIVELGANAGNMSIYLQTFALEAQKVFHAYDSFAGLPPHGKQDETEHRTTKGGDLAVSQAQFESKFQKYGVPLPVIHKGWFHEQQYPDMISFAFLDGDFYMSILDSWRAIYPRLATGAIVCVHDYGYPPLPGVKQACDDFLANKPDVLQFWDDYVAIFVF